MRKLLAKELKITYVETMNKVSGFHYGEGNPFEVTIGDRRYFTFLKNLSPAYFINSPDITRIQLPYSNHFSDILTEEIPFVILGFDADRDVFVSWDPKRIRERLNSKSNVSLYSRDSFQAKVLQDEYKIAYLTNGDKIVLFKRERLIKYYEILEQVFASSEKAQAISTNSIDSNKRKLVKISDTKLINQIKPLLIQNRVLESVTVCMKFYQDKYQEMQFRDWYKLVTLLYNHIHNVVSD